MGEEPKVIDRRPMEWIGLEAHVNASDLAPLIEVAAGVGDDRVWASTFNPSVTTATGLRFIQAAIEAERDAALVKYLRDDLAVQMGMEVERERVGFAAMVLDGLRRHREQFDARAGSTSEALSADDPTRPPKNT